MIRTQALRPFALPLVLALALETATAQGPPPDSGILPPGDAAPPVEIPPPVEAPSGSPSAGAAQVPETAGLASPAPPGANGPSAGPSFDAFSTGAGGFSPFMNPVVGRSPFRVGYSAAWFPSEPVSGQPTNLGYVRQDLIVSFPCWQDGKADEWSALASVRSEVYDTHAILPDTHQPFPDDLWDIRLGTTYRHLFDNGWIAGGTVSVGSASDQPFRGIDEMTAAVSAFLRVPSGEHNAWLFSLSYSPTAQLPFPIPMVAYLWQPSDCFRANLGLPFQLWWRPTDDLTFDFSYMLLTTVHARATYRLSRPVRLYAAYVSESEGYLLADRPDVQDRFYNVDQRATAGAMIFLGPHAALDLCGGYVFGRYFFEGKSIARDTNFDRVDVGDGPYLSVQLQVRW